ncbi:hypothetical protein JCM11641_004525 [Rhodosporidiobolus odoratus]
MPFDKSLARDVPLYLVLLSIASLPLLQQTKSTGPSSLRGQARDLYKALTKALTLVIGATGSVVLITGTVLAAEKGWTQYGKHWWSRFKTALSRV